ncbi:hypothetical protein C0J52_01872 [Blattella germanica]|nr:hypothetical protein C0J52_01872 [Blattella germanica]
MAERNCNGGEVLPINQNGDDVQPIVQNENDIRNKRIREENCNGGEMLNTDQNENLTHNAASEEVPDPMCLSGNPVKLHFEDITSAAFKIKSGIICTPCMVHIFKERGACYALLMLPEEQKRKGVISASLGNHALALSYHGYRLNIPVTVVMPIVAPIMKIQSCRKHGANVVVQGKDMGEAKNIAMQLSREHNLTYINGYDHPHIMAGQGTLGLEIAEQVNNVDAVIVPVGGGGLIAGVALAVKTLYPETKIIVVVKEEWIAIAILRLVELEKCVVEGAGAAGLAAILAGHVDELKGKSNHVKVVCETRDLEHSNTLKETLYQHYKRVTFGEIPSPSLLGGEESLANHS